MPVTVTRFDTRRFDPGKLQKLNVAQTGRFILDVYCLMPGQAQKPRELQPRDDGQAEQVGIDLSRPCIGLLTNVLWDAQLFYSSSVFENMMDWLNVTVRHFEARRSCSS